MLKALLITCAVAELGAGLGLVFAPARLTDILVGGAISGSPGLEIARIAGVALIALAIACWAAREDSGSRAACGIVGAMFVYNAGAGVVLVHAGLSGRHGIGLWPTALLHACLAVWCIFRLRSCRALRHLP